MLLSKNILASRHSVCPDGKVQFHTDTCIAAETRVAMKRRKFFRAIQDMKDRSFREREMGRPSDPTAIYMKAWMLSEQLRQRSSTRSSGLRSHGRAEALPS